jgi:hypothetical protein
MASELHVKRSENSESEGRYLRSSWWSSCGNSSNGESIAAILGEEAMLTGSQKTLSESVRI